MSELICNTCPLPAPCGKTRLKAKLQDPCQVFQDHLQVSTAAALYSMGGAYQDAAATVVMNILQQSPDHWEGLYLYAGIAADRGMTEDAVRVLLRLLVHDPEHAGVRCIFTQAGQADS